MAINIARRKTVMTRSKKLGHCICNPRQGCPCDVFREHNVCPCAGEKLPVKTGSVPLTQHVRKAGCASKIGQADLQRILSKLPPVTDPNVLVGTAAGDDAGIYRLDDKLALVQTVDVFTPCVDDPYLFGQIAAANSLSDVFAMGGKPLTALSIVGFPIDDLDGSIMEVMIAGGMEKLEEANCSLIGGHSINDEEIKFGFAVTGIIDAEKTVERNKARVGDVLVLTKPLGTGMISFAAQIGRVTQECLDEVGASMASLNKDAAELMVEFGAHACTDVTGFGLAGHLVEMVRLSRMSAEVDLSAIPVFAAVEECVANDILSGAIERNQEYSMAWVKAAQGGEEKNLTILYDPQTSGGLLISMPEERAKKFVEEMLNRGHGSTSIFGRIVEAEDEKSEGKLLVTNTRFENLVGKREGIVMAKDKKREPVSSRREVKTGPNPGQDFECCAPGARAAGGEGGVSGAKAAASRGDAVDPLSTFMEFMKQANQEGLIDRRSKKLMAVALSVAQRCKPCLAAHLKGAREMGISRAEIDEAANLAIAFGGCTVMMFYNEACKELKV